MESARCFASLTPLGLSGCFPREFRDIFFRDEFLQIAFQGRVRRVIREIIVLTGPIRQGDKTVGYF